MSKEYEIVYRRNGVQKETSRPSHNGVGACVVMLLVSGVTEIQIKVSEPVSDSQNGSQGQTELSSPSTESQATNETEGTFCGGTPLPLVKAEAVGELESALWPEAKDIGAMEGQCILKAQWREHPARALNLVRMALEHSINQYEELRLIRAEALKDAGINNVTVGMLSQWAADLRVKRESIAHHRRALIEVQNLIPKHQTAEAL